jgi:hypothetical protein
LAVDDVEAFFVVAEIHDMPELVEELLQKWQSVVVLDMLQLMAKRHFYVPLQRFHNHRKEQHKLNRIHS